jgi:CubicO group peptidase (beta-lactamase class C family)
MKTCTFLILILFHFHAMAQDFSKIDEIFASYQDSNPGAAVALLKDGQVVFARCYGMANLEDKIKISEKTNFRLASVSKQFTAAAILQLVQAHKLTLQTRLSDCFPLLPAYAKDITIKHLLNHTSGIPDYDEVIDESENTSQISDEGVLLVCATFTKSYFKPCEHYRYCNTAYVLLGLIIQKYSGLSYPQYLARHIFEPLKMDRSVAYVKGTNQIKNRAYGYSKQENTWIRKDQSSTSATLGDGGIYTSLNDLYKWDAALYNDSVLPREIWQSAFQHQKLNNGIEINYGYGWHLKKSGANDQVVYHTGSTTSFRNVFYRIPAKRLSVIILTNRNTPSEAGMLDLAEQVLSATGNL